MVTNAGRAPSPRPRKRGKLFAFLILLAVLLLCAIVLRHPGNAHLRAIGVLWRFSSPQSTGVRYVQYSFSEQMATAIIPAGTLQYRLYIPRGVQSPPGMVLLHGVHHLGMDEPRLVGFARALAGAGIEVMTPELKDLADYHITPETIDVIGLATIILNQHVRTKSVGVMGLSFAGGMALLAANRPEYAENIGFVVAVGAHDDMSRVARFFASNRIERPDGSNAPLQAHEYGVLVLAYSHLEDFFSASDVPAAHKALRLWLLQKPDDALNAAHQLSPAGQTEFDQLLHHRDQLQQQLLREIDQHSDEMQAVSPHGHLDHLKAPVFLLHGSGDTVIPASETLWLEQDVPRPDLRAALISPALVHVSMEETVPFSEKWAVVNFLAGVMKMTDEVKHQER